ncbi:hypothetical protein [Marinobacter salarius]|uniref:hypothetical protein n=1 Tax=Marinobacter salarius TaxID=1420917 RepID=UPI0032EAC68A
MPDNEIVKMFQRYLTTGDPSEIDNLDAKDLVAAEARLSVRGMNPNFTAVMKAQIAKLEQKESRRHESRVRALGLVTALLVGLVIAGISAWAFGT